MPAKPWCAQHQMHPSDCFDLHHPKKKTRAETAEEMKARVAKEHIRLQEARFGKSIIDARKRFEEKKGA